MSHNLENWWAVHQLENASPDPVFLPIITHDNTLNIKIQKKLFVSFHNTLKHMKEQ